jgi:hypothetical protein
MQSNRTCAYRACQIFDLDAIRTFRREVFATDPTIPQPPCPELISDLWDQSAAHLVLLCRDEIVGVIRFARPVNGKLPLHERMPELMAPEPVREISRVLIHPAHRASEGNLVFEKCIFDYICCNPSNLVVDVIDRAGAHVRGHLIRIGFTDTGLRYWDERYAAQSSILWGREENVITHLKKYFEDARSGYRSNSNKTGARASPEQPT